MTTSVPAHATEPHRLRVVLFGLNNETTSIVLRSLIAAGHRPQALIVPDTAAPHLIGDDAGFQIARPPETTLALLPPVESNHIVRQAWAAGLPVWVVRDLADPNIVQSLVELTPDVGVVACFSRRISQDVLDIFRNGILNLHPSLLPAHRGPAPLFWQFQSGETATGVTVHLMDDGLDTGDILAQRRIALPDGIAGPEATRKLTSAGVELVIEQLNMLSNGGVDARPQPPGGSYFGWPSVADFAIYTDWTAQRAYNFMRGTADWGRPYRIVVHDQTHWLAEALGYSVNRPPAAAAELPENEVWIPLADGALWARLALELGPMAGLMT